MHLVLATSLWLATPAPVAVKPAEAFETPEGLEAATDFWTSIYATYSTKQVVMHDNRYLHIVYGVLDFRSFRGSDAALERKMDDDTEAERERIIALLMELDSMKDGVVFSKLTPEQRKVWDAFRDVDELDKFRAAAERVRAQRGQREKFMEGIANVAPYMPTMEQIFRKRGLPSDLTRLVFVESMFNLHAYSKVGAAGPWQFMSGTGKRFLTINTEVDERMEPIRATEAAARLLEENYAHLGNWGLALTAYNHGVAGMKRAVREIGSDSIEQIVWNYESRSFGFASRNFYAEFLAARQVYNDREKYFGAELAKYPPKSAPQYEEIVLPDHVAISTLVKYCGVTEQQIRELNPQLTRYVLSGQKYLPKSYPLKVPAGSSTHVVKAYARIPRDLRFAQQKPNEFHVVKRGETLVAVARKYGMSVDAIMDLNNLSSRNRLRAGQKLRVLAPEKATLVAKKEPTREAAPKVKVLPAVKLEEDLAPVPAEETTLPVPELPAEEEAALAAASAPAVDLAPSMPAPKTPLVAAAEAPLAAVLAGRATLLGLVSLPIVPVAEAAIAAPASTAAGASPVKFGFGAAVSAVEALVAPAPAAVVTESVAPAVSPAAFLADSPAPRRDARTLAPGERPDAYPGGIHCRLAAP